MPKILESLQLSNNETAYIVNTKSSYHAEFLVYLYPLNSHVVPFRGIMTLGKAYLALARKRRIIA